MKEPHTVRFEKALNVSAKGKAVWSSILLWSTTPHRSKCENDGLIC